MTPEPGPEMLKPSVSLQLTQFCNAMADNARVQVISILMNGTILSASAIAGKLRMSPQATRFHLRILEEAQLIAARLCGRHRYYEIASHDIAEQLESIFGIIVPPPVSGDFQPAFSEARCCYKHLAGAFAVDIAHALEQGKYITHDGAQFKLEPTGQQFFIRHGIVLTKNIKGLLLSKRCIDVTHRRAHLGGRLGASLLNWMFEKDWLRAEVGQRALCISAHGRSELQNFISALQTATA